MLWLLRFDDSDFDVALCQLAIMEERMLEVDVWGNASRGNLEFLNQTCCRGCRDNGARSQLCLGWETVALPPCVSVHVGDEPIVGAERQILGVFLGTVALAF